MKPSFEIFFHKIRYNFYISKKKKKIRTIYEYELYLLPSLENNDYEYSYHN